MVDTLGEFNYEIKEILAEAGLRVRNFSSHVLDHEGENTIIEIAVVFVVEGRIEG